VATVSADNTARLWDAVSGKPIGVPLVHQGIVSSVAFSPNGRQLAVAEGSTVHRYLIRPDDLIQYVCEYLPFNLPKSAWDRYLPDEAYRKACPNLP
jgi:WD40 repeat protein